MYKDIIESIGNYKVETDSEDTWANNGTWEIEVKGDLKSFRRDVVSELIKEDYSITVEAGIAKVRLAFPMKYMDKVFIKLQNIKTQIEVKEITGIGTVNKDL